MARKVVVTKAEQDALSFALERISGLEYERKHWAGLETLLAKLVAPKETKVAGLSLRDVEIALIGIVKYTRWLSGNPGRHLRLLQQAGATPEQITKVGRWLDHQTWMRGRWTLASLASKWGEWYSQAAAFEPGPVIGSRPAGFR